MAPAQFPLNRPRAVGSRPHTLPAPLKPMTGRQAGQGRCTTLIRRPPSPDVSTADGALADCGVMSDRPPDLHMLNLVVGDMSASLDFYRRLGIAVPLGEDAAGAHVQLRMPGGFSLELDTAESAQLWHAGWRAVAPDPGGGR